MKYIRTNDGIYEVVGFDEECIIPSILIKVKNNYLEKRITHCCTYDIIKDADTVEELCDGFYIDDGQEFCLDDIFTYFYKFETSYKYYNKTGNVKYDGYGFIKTSKGLIYVAKMNESGELELI